MNRGFGGRLSADATIKGTLQNPVIDGHVDVVNGSFQSYKYESLKADVDYTADRIGLDATLRQSATESITAKVGADDVVQVEPGRTRRRDREGRHRSARDVHGAEPRDRAGVHQPGDQRLRDARGRRARYRLRTGSAPAGPHRHQGGAFGVPAGGVSYSGLNTRVDLEPDRIRLQKFAILDEHGEPLNVAGELAVHAREIGAVNLTIDSDNFEVIDNELGDVGVDSELTITGELRRPVVRGTVRLEAARLEVDRILQLFYDPHRSRSCLRSCPRSGRSKAPLSAQEATTSALRRAETTPAIRRRSRRRGLHAGRRVRPGGARRAAQDPGQPRAPRQEAAARRSHRRVARRHEHHRWRRPAGREARERPGAPARGRRDRARHLRIPGPAVRPGARRHAAVHGRAAAESRARHGTAHDPEYRRGSPRPRAGHGPAPQLSLSSNPRSKSPTSSR